MARIRTIKPELFLDEDIGAMHGDAVLLFIGLWTLADREGRLECRPKRIKASLFPYRDVDVEGHLDTLEDAGKVMRYGQDREFLWIPGFVKHQRPHPKEATSTLPEPPSRGRPRPVHEKAVDHPVASRGEGKGREGDLGSGKEISGCAEPGTVTQAAETLHDALATAEPPSPEDLLHQALQAGDVPPGTAAAEHVAQEPPEKFELQAVIPGAEEPTPDELAAAWNFRTSSSGFATVRLPLGDGRRRECRKALKRRPLDGPEGWRAVFERFSKAAGAVGKPWADFDFAIRDGQGKGESAEKILAGKYDRDYDKPAGPRVQTPEENAAKWKELEGKSDIDF